VIQTPDVVGGGNIEAAKDIEQGGFSVSRILDYSCHFGHGRADLDVSDQS
jgi:hypothetical protein